MNASTHSTHRQRRPAGARQGGRCYAQVVQNSPVSTSFQSRLERYADLIVHAGVGLAPGQELIVNADICHLNLVRLISGEAYRAGAKNVTVIYGDEASALIRYANAGPEAIEYAPQWFYDALTTATESGAALLTIDGANPALLRDVDPAKVAASGKARAIAGRKLAEIIGSWRTNWCIAAYATPAWASMVFPDESADTGVSKLWDAIFACTNADQPDPVAHWWKHALRLDERAKELTERHYDAIHLKGPGTDLRVGLVRNHVWGGGKSMTQAGIACSPNMPTEEVFTMPHRERVDGVVSSTKPLSVRGQVIDKIRVEFKDGRAVSASAEKGEDVLRRLLDTDENARRLGEVALVPYSSAVSRTDLLYFNTLFDENAACHIAFGRAIDDNLPGSSAMTPDQRMEAGVNDSLIHVDWMIGSDEIDVDGICPNGSAEPLMRSGEFIGL